MRIFIFTLIFALLCFPANAEVMRMSVEIDSHEIIFELNDTPAAQSLYKQLPFSVEVSDYAGQEKIFYPPEKLETAQSINANAKTGDLALFSPWGNVVMYYKDFGSYNGLYALGKAVEGAEYIKNISDGTYKFERK